MLIPIGDNIERRTFPIVPTVLIFANALVFAYEFRILSDAAQTHGSSQIREFVNTWGPRRFLAGIHLKENQDGFPINDVGNDKEGQ